MPGLYGRTSLQQLSKESCSLHVSGHNRRADYQRRTPGLLTPLNSDADLAPASVMLAVVALISRQWSV